MRCFPSGTQEGEKKVPSGRDDVSKEVILTTQKKRSRPEREPKKKL